MILQFVDNESVAGDCPTSELLRRTLHQFHHNLKVHCGLSQDSVDGEHRHVEEMTNKQIMKKIWKLLWNKCQGGVDVVDYESMHVLHIKLPTIILTVICNRWCHRLTTIYHKVDGEMVQRTNI